MRTDNSNKANLSAVGAALALTVLSAGCATSSQGSAAPQTTSTAMSTASSTADATPTSAATGSATAQQVLADWIGSVIAGDYTKACTDMADTSTSPAQPQTPTTCASGNAKVVSMQSVLKGLRTTFTPQQATGPAHVQVAGAPATGTATTIAADKVTVGGQRLDQILLARSTGVKLGQTNVTFGLTKISGSWYLTGFNLNM